MRFFGLTPWRIFLILWAAFVAIVTLALLGHRWAIVAFRIIECLVLGAGDVFLVSVFAWLVWEKRQERKHGDTR